jgi:hypothetical protein
LKRLSELDRLELRTYLRQARKRAPVGKCAARIEEGVVTRIKPLRIADRGLRIY